MKGRSSAYLSCTLSRATIHPLRSYFAGSVIRSDFSKGCKFKRRVLQDSNTDSWDWAALAPDGQNQMCLHYLDS